MAELLEHFTVKFQVVGLNSNENNILLTLLIGYMCLVFLLLVIWKESVGPYHVITLSDCITV